MTHAGLPSPSATALQLSHVSHPELVWECPPPPTTGALAAEGLGHPCPPSAVDVKASPGMARQPPPQPAVFCELCLGFSSRHGGTPPALSSGSGGRTRLARDCGLADPWPSVLPPRDRVNLPRSLQHLVLWRLSGCGPDLWPLETKETRGRGSPLTPGSSSPGGQLRNAQMVQGPSKARPASTCPQGCHEWVLTATCRGAQSSGTLAGRSGSLSPTLLSYERSRKQPWAWGSQWTSRSGHPRPPPSPENRREQGRRPESRLGFSLHLRGED